MENQYSVDFYLKSGKRVVSIINAQDISTARELIEDEISSEQKTIIAEISENFQASVLVQAIEYFEVRPYNLHPQRNK